MKSPLPGSSGRGREGVQGEEMTDGPFSTWNNIAFRKEKALRMLIWKQNLRRFLFETSNSRLPLEYDQDHHGTLPICVSDGSLHFHVFDAKNTLEKDFFIK